MIIGDPNSRDPFNNRGPYYESVMRLAPIFVAVFFAVIAVGLVRNYIDAKMHPESQGRTFDPAKDFSRLSRGGMVRLMTQKDK